MSYAVLLAVAWAALGGGALLAMMASFAGELTLVGYIENPAMQYLASPDHAFTLRSASLAVVGLSLALFVGAHFLAVRRWPFWATGDRGEDRALAQALRRGDWGFVGGRMKLALIRDPGSPTAHANLGVALWGLGRLEEAAASFEKAAEGGVRGRIQASREALALGLTPLNLVTRPRLPIVSAALGIPVLVLAGFLGKVAGQVFRENSLTHYDASEFEVLYTEGFKILHHDRVFATDFSTQAEEISKTVMEDLGVAPDDMPKGLTQIFLCSDIEEYKSRNRLAVASWSAGHAIWQTRTTFVYPSPGLMSDTLPHELTHIILGQATGCSESWVHEGVAMYIGFLFSFEHNHDRMPMALERIKLFDLLKGGRHFHVADLLSTEPSELEDPARVEVFYVQSFSLIYFLREKYGPAKFHRFIDLLKIRKSAKAALTEAYREDFRDFDDLEGSWLVYFTL